MHGIHSLDNPIWNALNTIHAGLALGGALARRYPPEIGPLSGLADQSDAAYEELRTLAAPDGIVALFLPESAKPRPGWTLLHDGELSQMVCPEPLREAMPALPAAAHMRRLTASDVPEMVALTKLTEPGPFRTRTHELGTFFGIFEDNRLVSMAGQRLRVPGFVEVSAVCTHPVARGKGYARALILAVMEEIRRGDATPFLHSYAHNHAAIRVYQGLGFTLRHTMQLAVLKNEAVYSKFRVAVE